MFWFYWAIGAFWFIVGSLSTRLALWMRSHREPEPMDEFDTLDGLVQTGLLTPNEAREIWKRRSDAPFQAWLDEPNEGRERRRVETLDAAAQQATDDIEQIWTWLMDKATEPCPEWLNTEAQRKAVLGGAIDPHTWHSMPAWQRDWIVSIMTGDAEPDTTWLESFSRATLWRFTWNGLNGLESREEWMNAHGYRVYGSADGPSAFNVSDDIWCERQVD